jgi:2-keto-4-pentenoate hydratase
VTLAATAGEVMDGAEGRIAGAALRLLEARQARQRIDGLGPLAPDTLDEAYAVQAASLAGILALAGGGTLAGYKIGCTNPTAQAEIGIHEPFHGALLSPFVHGSPAMLPAERFFMTVLEPEIAFRIGRDLPPAAAPFSRDAVYEAVAAVLPAIEIVDSRYRSWTTAGAAQIVADNAANGAWVHGAERTDLDLLRLDELAVRIEVNGAERGTGVGANALGHPLNALTWLAHELARKGGGLKAGDLVSTGTCTATVAVSAGDRALASFGPLGQVELSLT